MTKMTEKELAVCDAKAEKAIKVMLAAVAATAIVPAHVNWALTASAMGSGCVAIGMAYGIQLDKEEGWALCKQFIMGAGFWFVAMNIGSKLFAAVAESTGIGYVAGAGLDVAISCACAWAIGGCARAYFRKMVQGRQATKAELKALFQACFREYKSKATAAA